MSKTIDQRVVEMRFDNSQFEKGVSESISSLDKLKASLNFDNLMPKSSIDSISSNISKLGNSVDSIADRFSVMGIAATAAIAKVSTSVIDLAENAFQRLIQNAEAGYNRYNEMMESVQTIMYATRDEWDDTGAQMDYVTDKIDKLNWYTDETSYNLSDMTNSIGKFVSAGVDLDDAVTAMEGIASWAAISGQNAQKASYAMYNLSQAMAMGKLTNADWKSIENANMATKEFKKTAYDTAVEVGTLERVWVDEWGDTAVFYTGKLKEGQDATEGVLITAENLRTTLQYGWFNQEVITKTLKKYGDFADELYKSVNEVGVTTTEYLGYLNDYEEALKNGEDMDAWVKKLASKEKINDVVALSASLEKLSGDYYELGRASFKAAQESKTFKDSLDYTKDALTTTWMNIFQDIFGNYLASKALWTDMSELMYEQLVAPIEEVEEQLSSWNNMGGSDMLKDAFWNVYGVIKDIQDAIKEGWEMIFPNDLARQLIYIIQDILGITEKLQLKDRVVFSDYNNIRDAVASLARVFLDFKISLGVISRAIKDAWTRIFPGKETTSVVETFGFKIKKFGEWLEELSAKFRLTGEDGKKLERTFAGIFALLDIGRLLLIAILEPFTEFDAEVGEVSHGIFDVTASIGDWLVALRDFIKENDVFGKTIRFIINIIKQIPVYADALSRKIFGMGITELLQEMVQTASGLFLLLGGLFVDFESTMDQADEYMANSRFATIWPIIKNLILGVKATIDDLSNFFNKKGDESGDGIISKFTNIWLKIKEFFNTIKMNAKLAWDNVVNFAATALEAITGFFDGVKDEISDIFASTDDDSLTTGQKIKGVFSSIGEKISAVFSSDKVKNAWSALTDFFGRLGTKIRDKLGQSKLGQWFIDISDKMKEFFASIPEKAGEVWAKLKEFFGLAGTKAGEIWDSIPGWIENAKTNIKDFFETIKQKFLYIWGLIQPYVETFVNAMKQFAATIAEHWDEIWGAIVGFFTWLGENGKKAIDFITETDWVEWWGKVKLWCENAWDAVRHFFEQLPDKSKRAFEDLTGVGWEEFLDNLKTGWENFKDAVQEAWDKVTEFCEDAPEKLDNFAKKAGFDDWPSLWDDVSTKIGEAWQNLKYFFGIEKPEWMGEDGKPLMKFDETNMPEGWTAEKINNFKTWKDLIPDLSDIFVSLDEFADTDFAKHVRTILGIAAVLAAMFLVWKIFTSMKDLLKSVNDLRAPWKAAAKDSFMGGLFGDLTDEIEKIGKAASWKLYADTFVEIAGALAIIAAIRPERLETAVFVMIVIFGMLLVTMKLMTGIKTSKFSIEGADTKKLMGFATAMDMMAGVLVAIAGSLWLIGQLDYGKMWSSFGVMILLFEAIVSVFVYFDYVGFPNAEKVQAFAFAVGELSGVFMVIAYAMAIIGHMRIDRMIGAAVSLGALFGALIFSLVIISKFNVKIDGVMSFAKAVGALSGTLIVIAIAMRILDGMEVENMLGAVLSLSLLFLALISAFVVIDKMAIKQDKMREFAIAMDILSVTLIAIALSMRIMKGMDWTTILSGAAALVALVGILTIALGVIGKININEGSMLAFAGAMAILGVAMLEMAAALWVLRDVEPAYLWDAVGALSALAVVMTVLGALSASYVGAGMLIFATAFLLLGTGAMAAGLGINLLASALERLSAIGVEGFQGITDGLTILSEGAPHIVDGFLEALMHMAEQAGPIIVTFFTSLANAISENRETITAGIVDFWMILIDAFRQVVPELLDAIHDALNQLISNARDTLTRIANIINSRRELFTTALTNFFMIFVDTMRNVGPEFVDALGEILRAIVVKLQEIWPDIEAFLLMAGDTALLLLGQLVTGLIQILIYNGPLLLELLEFLFEGTLGIIEKYTPLITELAFNLLMDTLNHILDNIDDVTSVTTQIGIATVLGFIDGLTQKIPDIIESGVQFVLALVNGVAKGLDDHAEEVAEALRNCGRAMIRAFLIFMGMDPDDADSIATRWVDIGKDLMSSLAQGLVDGIDKIQQVSTNIANALLGAFAGETEIASPSKVFERYGEYCDLGLVEGLNKGQKQVLDTTKSMADRALDSLGGTFKNLKDKIFGDFEFDPTITPVLDMSKVTEGANYINDLFSADRAMELAGLNDFDINNMESSQDKINSLLDKFGMASANSNNQNEVINNNTFNITGSDPQAIASEVSNILQSQVERRDSLWA